jgi:aspartyl-tRNA synthetase
VGQEVTLCGWVDSSRDHGGAVFLDVRDRYGKTQVVAAPEAGSDIVQAASRVRSEYVVRVTGKVAPRPEGTTNPKLPTGAIELRVAQLEVLNPCAMLPFAPSQQELPGEDLRLKYRYLDLRRPEMQRTMLLRGRIIKLMRDYFDEHGFIDVETPILGRSTPEGARDYLVPSRVHRGKFYALPQSPQLYKQILMVAGYDRYVQIARCFRDEDLRADRQPEFTQLDLEMSFVTADDIIRMIDGLVARLARELLGLDVPLPLPRMTYDEAMRRFGHDAPDLRFDLELVDCSDLAASCEFALVRGALERGGFLRGLRVPGAASRLSRKRIDELTEYVKKDLGGQNLIWFRMADAGQLESSWAKNFAPELLGRIGQRLSATPGDMLFLMADSWEVTCRALYGLRKRLGAELQLYDPRQMHFSWVVEFPMFDWDPEGQRWSAMHHPFTSPRLQDIAMLEEQPAACRAQAYDLVINGYEAGGGTIRIHDAPTQQRVFNLLGIDAPKARERFGFLLDALQFGAPPHGGIALGFDRMIAMLCGTASIRDVIAFPKTAKGTDLMAEAPGDVSARQLKELYLELKAAKKE